MVEHQLIMLAGIGVVSLICQWVAWRLRLPAILFLLLAGIALGPYSNWLNPNQLLGDLLFPIVSLAVAVILFEGSLTLQFKEIQGHGKMVRKLLTIGMITTWFTATLACKLFFNFSWGLATLFGSIVIVTGPTVIMPLLRAVRPTAKLANILQWEGIIIDPIGALLAVLVYEFMISDKGTALVHTLQTFSYTLALGVLLGLTAGYILGVALRRHWFPQFLQNAGTLTFTLGVYAASNYFAHESGLLTITIMGILLANMKDVPVDDILEFKESLSVLLISALFIILAARIDIDQLTSLGWGPVWIILVLLFISRPLSIWLSAIGTPLSWQEKVFLSWIAPRGIVAAAVSALFAFKLESQGYSGAGSLVPLVFIVIVSTVIIQSLTSSWLARFLGVKQPDANGFIFIGANIVSRRIAKALMNKDIPVILTDTNWDNIKQARMENIAVYFGNPVSEHAENHIDLTCIGHMLAISPYKQLNTLSTFHFLDLFGTGHVFGLSEGDQDNRASHQSSGKYIQTRNLFGDNITFAKLASLIAKGSTVKTTQLSPAYTYDDYKKQYSGRLLMLFAISPQKKVFPICGDSNLNIGDGWEVISLIQPETTKAESPTG